jgi:hypothetical protein
LPAKAGFTRTVAAALRREALSAWAVATLRAVRDP